MAKIVVEKVLTAAMSGTPHVIISVWWGITWLVTDVACIYVPLGTNLRFNNIYILAEGCLVNCRSN